MLGKLRAAPRSTSRYLSLLPVDEKSVGAHNPLDCVRQWLSEATSDEIQAELDAVVERRPKDLKLLSAALAGGRPWSTDDSLRIGVDPPAPATARQATEISDLPILQFSCGKYFCLEDEDSVTITVIRVGNIAARSTVRYRTKEKTAIAGVNYIPTEGLIVWERGEVDQTFQVPLIDDQHWAGVVEFRVELDAGSAENGIVPFGGAEARVQRIDDDVFPSNKYRHLICARRVSEVSPLGLFLEFFKVVFDDPVVRRGSIRMVLAGQLHNVFCICQLIANVYMVDHVLLPTAENRNPPRQMAELLLLTGLSFLPHAVMHILRYSAFSWRVVGKTRVRLASGLMNAFLYLNDSARTELDGGALVDAMTHNTEQLIKCGYLNFLVAIQLMGRILMCVVFQLVAPMMSCSHSWQTLSLRMLPMLLFPICMAVAMAARMGRTREALKVRLRSQRALVASVHEIVDNFRLIADFGRRQWCMDQHQESVLKFGASDKAVAEISCNNNYLMKWLTLFAVSSYVVVGGFDVINGSLPAGIYLTCLRVYVQVGKLWSDVYGKFLQTFDNAPALERIVDIINKPTDLRNRMQWSRHQHHITSTKFKEMQGDVDLNAPPGKAIQDRIPIQMRSVGVSLRALGTSEGHVGTEVRATSMFYETITVHQGKLVCLVGKRGMGKSTLLRIFGGAMLPEAPKGDGIFLIPSHLRVLHVPSEDMFIKGSLYQNLTFGVQKGHPDGCLSRVHEICRSLGLPPSLVDRIQEEGSPSVSWGETLSGSEKHMLVIARALIANPEVLCIHKPTLHVNDRAGEKIVGLLRDFVDQRGICLPKEEKHLRRPRTCVMTSTRLYSLSKADEIFKVAALIGDADHGTPSTDAKLRPSVAEIHSDALNSVDADDLS